MGCDSLTSCLMAIRINSRSMSLVWEKSGEAFYATVTDLAGLVRGHLIVEPGGIGCDWAVWRPGEHKASAKHGRAATLHGAMWDAEMQASG
jgi:hypothetical protein